MKLITAFEAKIWFSLLQNVLQKVTTGLINFLTVLRSTVFVFFPAERKAQQNLNYKNIFKK